MTRRDNSSPARQVAQNIMVACHRINDLIYVANTAFLDRDMRECGKALAEMQALNFDIMAVMEAIVDKNFTEAIQLSEALADRAVANVKPKAVTA